MGGIPWWAALIGTPIAAGKMASGVTETVEALNKVNELLDNRADKKQYAADLAAFGKDPNHLPQSSDYRNPDTAYKVISDFQKQAAPSLLSQFKTGYEALTGTSDPRFFGDAESRAELAKGGLKSAANNPFLNASLADFQKEGEQRQTLKAASEGDPLALANLGADKDLASSFHLAQQGFDIPVKRQQAEEKELREQTKESEKKQLVKNISDFQSTIAGLTGPAKSRQGIAQFATNGGYAPFPEVESDIRQAASALGVGDSDEVNKAVTRAREFYEKTFLPAETIKVGRTTATGQRNLLGDFRKDATSTAPIIKINTGPKPPSGYRYATDGNLEPIPGGPAARVKPGKPLPPSAVDFFSDTPMLVQNLSEARELAGKVSTGPVAGRMQSLAATVDGASDDFVNLQQKFATVNNIMLKARSGAAVTESEFKRFLKEMPNENDSPRTLQLKLKNATTYINRLIDTKRREYSKAGYQVGDDAAPQGAAKTVVKKFVSPSTGKTKLVYSDGTEEIR